MPKRMFESYPISTHNLLLLLLVETGIIGFILFGMGMKHVLESGWRARHIAGMRPLSLIVPLCIVGCLSSDPHQLHVFWVGIAYALAAQE